MEATRQSYVNEGSQGTKGTTEDVFSTALSPMKAFSHDIAELHEGWLFQPAEVNMNFVLPDIRPLLSVFVLKTSIKEIRSIRIFRKVYSGLNIISQGP